MEKCRCSWCLSNSRLMEYHDSEWGVPLYDDRKQFEFLMLEVMQCGLNWNLVLAKREVFSRCFAEFDYEAVARFSEKEIGEILAVPGMIRSRRKIEAVIHNAGCVIGIRSEFGSFSKYLWGFTGGKVMRYPEHAEGNVPPKNELSETVAADLKRRGFRYLGPVTVYSHLQACGIINDHHKDCFRYGELAEKEKHD